MNKYLFFKSIYKDYIIIFEKNNNFNYIIIDNNFNVTFYKSTLL